MPSKNLVLKEAKNQYIEVVDLMINELLDASKMTKSIFEKIL